MSAGRLACVMALLAWLAALTPAQACRAADQPADASPDMPNSGEHSRGLGSAGTALWSGPGRNHIVHNIRPTSLNGPGRDGSSNGLERPDIPETRVKFVAFLPPDKTGMTTGGPGGVTILINRNYPLFVQYSTLIHEGVHARDRRLGITPYLTTAQRETRALAVELSPANVLATTALAVLTEGPQTHRLATFFQDVRAHYRYYSALARISHHPLTAARDDAR